MVRSRSKDLSRTSSQVVEATARYSASVEARETTVCFFVRQGIGLVPRVMKNPVVERRVEGQPAQSESEYADILKS